MEPSRAQGLFLERFEDLYFEVDGHTLDTIPLGEPPTEERKKPEGWAPGIPRRTYLDWRSQQSSPTIRDLERLCALTRERQTLIVDPSPSSEGGDDMEWLDDADRIIARLGSMGPHQRSKLLGRIETMLEHAEREQQNPPTPAEAVGSRHGRRK